MYTVTSQTQNSRIGLSVMGRFEESGMSSMNVNSYSSEMAVCNINTLKTPCVAV